jgi:hypothetical protein
MPQPTSYRPSPQLPATYLPTPLPSSLSSLPSRRQPATTRLSRARHRQMPLPPWFSSVQRCLHLDLDAFCCGPCDRCPRTLLLSHPHYAVRGAGEPASTTEPRRASACLRLSSTHAIPSPVAIKSYHDLRRASCQHTNKYPTLCCCHFCDCITSSDRTARHP